MTRFFTCRFGHLIYRTGKIGRVFVAIVLAMVLLLPSASREGRAAEGEIEIGVTSGVQKSPIGQPPISDQRQLYVGTNVVHDEQVTTTESDIAQLLFQDGSSITVGPNSNMILDEFIYDPDAGTGKIIVSATKGVFRFVGGKVSKKGTVEFRSPSGTIGIRGGIAIIEILPNGLIGSFLFGEQLFVASGGGIETTHKPGTIIIANGGGLPNSPQPLTVADLNGKLSQLEASAGAGGPSSAAKIAFIKAAITVLAGSNSDGDATDWWALNLNGENPGEGAAEDASQSAAAGQTGGDPPAAPPPGPPDPAPGPPVSLDTAPVVATLDGAALSSGPTPNTTGANVTSSQVTYEARQFDLAEVRSFDALTNEGQLTATAPIGVYKLYFPGSDNASPTTLSACPAALNCVVQFPGSAGNEDGLVAYDTNRTFFNYLIFRADGSRELVLAGTPYTGQIPAAGIQTYNLSSDLFLESGIPFLRTTDTNLAFGFGPRPAHVHWGNSHRNDRPFLTSTISIGDASRTAALSVHIGRVALGSDAGVTFAQNISGDFIGVIDPTGNNLGAGIGSTKAGEFDTVATNGTLASGASDFFGTAAPDFFALGIDPTPDRANSPGPGIYTYASGLGPGTDPYYPVNIASSAPANLTPTRSLTAIQGFATGIGQFNDGPAPAVLLGRTETPGGSSRITIDPAADTVAARFIAEDSMSSDKIIAETTDDAVTAYIDDDNFAATFESASENHVDALDGSGYLVTGTNTTVDGVAFDLCSTCAFMTWGYWGVGIENEGAVGAGIDKFSSGLGTWVAGQKTIPGNFPQAASIAYAGDIIGNVSNAGEFYVKTAPGGVAMDVTFGTSKYQITNFGFSFDGANYAGLGTGQIPNAQNYAIAGVDGARALSAAGYFYGPSAENTGGQFSITDAGADYFAAGVFAGEGTALPPPVAP